jgi:hypothetical protein
MSRVMDRIHQQATELTRNSPQTGELSLKAQLLRLKIPAIAKSVAYKKCNESLRYGLSFWESTIHSVQFVDFYHSNATFILRRIRCSGDIHGEIVHH